MSDAFEVWIKRNNKRSLSRVELARLAYNNAVEIKENEEMRERERAMIKDHGLAEIARELKKKTYTFAWVMRCMGNKWWRNAVIYYFRTDRAILFTEDTNGAYGTCAGIDSFEIEQRPRNCWEYGFRHPGEPVTFKNTCFCDTLTFHQDNTNNLRFHCSGDEVDPECVEIIRTLNKFRPWHHSTSQAAELKAEDITKIERLVVESRSLRRNVDFKKVGEPCFVPISQALDPMRADEYGKEWFMLRDRDLYGKSYDIWQWCPIDVKTQIFSIWEKYKEAMDGNDQVLQDELRKKYLGILPDRADMHKKIMPKQWENVVQFAKISATSNAIHEYANQN
jgi:hypothetical protein